jgi:hypothetical protein
LLFLFGGILLSGPFLFYAENNLAAQAAAIVSALFFSFYISLCCLRGFPYGISFCHCQLFAAAFSYLAQPENPNHLLLLFGPYVRQFCHHTVGFLCSATLADNSKAAGNCKFPRFFYESFFFPFSPRGRRRHRFPVHSVFR